MCCEGLIETFPQLDNCCFCLKVDTGSKVIAWLGAIGAFFYTVITTVWVVAFGVEAGSASSHDEVKNTAIVGLIFGLIMIFVLLFIWAMAVMLLAGLYKEDMGKVKLWLRVNICLFFFQLVHAVFNIISTICVSIEPPEEITTRVVLLLLQILFSLYMISIVKSHYKNKTEGFQTVSV